MNPTSRLIAVQCKTPQKGERLVACAPVTAVIAADMAKDAPLPDSIVWMPKGDHQISAGTMAGGTWEGLVRCDELGASVVMASFERARADGKRVWLDCNHDDGAATGDVRSFSWDPAQGIVAKVEWTPLGERCLREKTFYSFSPTFWVDWESGRVSGLVEGHAAGGLVNAPAFGAAMPALIAARLGSAETSSTPRPTDSGNNVKDTANMKDLLIKILAALGVKVPDNATEDQLTALVTEHAPKAQNAVTAAAQVSDLQKQINELKAKGDKPETVTAVAALQKQVDSLNAIAAAAKKERAESAVKAAVDRGALKADDTALQAKWVGLIEADEKNVELLAAMPGKPTAQSVVIASDVAQRGAVVDVLRTGIVDALKAYKAEPDHVKRAAIYASAIGPVVRDSSFRLGPVLAANSLGSISGDLVVQRALSLLKYQFPALTAFSTDFSDASAQFNQQIVSRIKAIPASGNYVAGAGYTRGNAVTTDVPVTISNHKGVEIGFNVNELSSTNRDLFGEQVEGAHQRIGLDITASLWALLTVENFKWETAIALADFSRAGLSTIAATLNGRGVPSVGRAAVLDSSYFSKLGTDSSIVSYAAFQRPELITEYTLPRVAGFQPYEAANLTSPTSENLVGFCGTPDALVVATRVPNDYAGDGSISVVTNPDTGISVQLVRYTDHTKAESVWRVAYMWGVAKGQIDSLERIVSTANASGS